MTTLLPLIIASTLALGSLPAVEPGSSAQESAASSIDRFDSASDLLDALAAQDQTTDSLTGSIRFTTINALENDRQMRLGTLAIERQSDGQRLYAVSFDTLEFDNRRENIDEEFIFDGRWFIERLPKEKQFNKRELVPLGETLDPMELMRDAPFWVSLGQDQDRLLASYDAELLPTSDGLLDNPDFPELRFFVELPHVVDTYQLKLTPKPGSGFEDDWEWVRIWINKDTLLPTLYIKSEWTGDLQIVELFSTKTNTKIPAQMFDTTTPDARSGWRVQISNWRGNE
jgi:outer membrane lipoprotein-sorting protein